MAMVLALFLLLSTALPCSAAVFAAYTVLGPKGAVARAVVDGGACPPITIDGTAAPMRVRAAADAQFPLVCEAVMPAGASRASIDGQRVPLPPHRVERVAAFGDSGCRVDASDGSVQACDDPKAWPFARTSALAASLAPDLVVHIGDYLYRESPCPSGYAGCAGTPSGDDWAAWQADFFAPAAPLLARAPWVLARGNHETCNRAGSGFFRLLDPRPLPQRCPRISRTYGVDVGGLRIYVLDSAAAPDLRAPGPLTERYRAAFRRLGGAPRGAWLVTHKPLWGVLRVSDALGLSVLLNDTATLEAASANNLPPGIALVLSGHIHLFEALGFADRRPPQLVLGTGGSKLVEPLDADLVGRAIGGTAISFARTAHVFGPTLLARDNGGWTATLRDEAGNTLFTCAISTGTLSCTP